MALQDFPVVRYAVPGEPDAWVELQKVPVALSQSVAWKDRELVALSVVAWSYDVPVNAANLARLDPNTYAFAVRLCQEQSHAA